MRLLASIMLGLAIAAMPLVSASGLACQGCPLTGGVVATAEGHSCDGCQCGVAGQVSEHAHEPGSTGSGTGSEAPSEQPEQPDQGCDCPIRCACGVAKAPIVVTGALCSIAPGGTCLIPMLSIDAMLSDPHLKRLKRPPRFTNSL